MAGKFSGESRLYLGVAVLVVLMVALVIFIPRPTRPPANTTVNNSARTTYASLYDALWRQDSGQGSILMTSTLFVPPMITALGQDTQRSEVEEQIWNAMKNMMPSEIGLFITLDSVTGFISDADIQKSLSLDAGPGLTFHLRTWQPIIGGASQVNANAPVASQRGLAIFTADPGPDAPPIDWSTLDQVTLRATGLGDQPVRQFVWTQVSALSQEQ